MSLDHPAQELLGIYRREVREFLAEHEVTGLDALDQNAELLERALASGGGLKIGFVGESQVGKSTLINALLDRQALPSGGIGPLTAQATRVTYADENSFVVKYHGKQQLNRLAFGIARFLDLRGDLKQQGIVEGLAVEEPDAGALDESPTLSTFTAAPEDGETDGSHKGEMGRYMLDQARRILRSANMETNGDGQNDIALLNAIRNILGHKPIGDFPEVDGFAARIEEIQAILGKTEEASESSESGIGPFNRALRQRAAGWMSPLVAELHLRLRTETLRGLSLIDLPGIGVAGDPAGKEAESFVRTEGDALIVVFRNSGVTESVAGLLERTGVITKLLFGGRDSIPPIQVVLAVTHLDDVARDRYGHLADEARDNGEPAPDRHEIYRTAAREMEAKIREMVGDALRASKSFEDLPDDQRKTREAVVTKLCRTMQVFCVASPDYLSIASGRDDGLAFLRDPEATSIPDLRRYLVSLARDESNRRRETVEQFRSALSTSIGDHLGAISKMYEEGRGVAIMEYERFRDAIAAAADPLREEMAAYHGESLGVLRSAMHSELSILCKNAELAGNRKLRRVSKDARSRHFMSVKAAFNRNGVWDSRGINYPDAITSAMVDSIASEWEDKIVEKVRAEVRTLADRDLKLVERLCDVARQTNERILADTPIDAQKKILQANSRTAVAWTKDQLDELRASVSKGLRTAVEKPIERVCARAKKQLVHEGPGARDRIIEAFEEGGESAIDEASKHAEQLLKEHYNKLLRKLNEGFLKENHDPIQSAVDTLTGEQITKARRADAQRKRRVNASVDEFAAKLALLTIGPNTPTISHGQPWHSANASA